jgi:hypothetical protein
MQFYQNGVRGAISPARTTSPDSVQTSCNCLFNVCSYRGMEVSDGRSDLCSRSAQLFAHMSHAL